MTEKRKRHRKSGENHKTEWCDMLVIFSREFFGRIFVENCGFSQTEFDRLHGFLNDEVGFSQCLLSVVEVICESRIPNPGNLGALLAVFLANENYCNYRKDYRYSENQKDDEFRGEFQSKIGEIWKFRRIFGVERDRGCVQNLEPEPPWFWGGEGDVESGLGGRLECWSIKTAELNKPEQGNSTYIGKENVTPENPKNKTHRGQASSCDRFQGHTGEVTPGQKNFFDPGQAVARKS